MLSMMACAAVPNPAALEAMRFPALAALEDADVSQVSDKELPSSCCCLRTSCLRASKAVRHCHRLSPGLSSTDRTDEKGRGVRHSETQRESEATVSLT